MLGVVGATFFLRRTAPFWRAAGRGAVSGIVTGMSARMLPWLSPSFGSPMFVISGQRAKAALPSSWIAEGSLLVNSLVSFVQPANARSPILVMVSEGSESSVSVMHP